MRRVLLVLEPPDGGVPELVSQLALNLAVHRWGVEVAGPPNAIIYPRLAAAGIPLHRLPLSRDHGDVRRQVASFRGLSRVLSNGRYDLLHCHSAQAGVLGRLAAWRQHIPAVYSPHALPFVGPFGLKRRVGSRAAERALAPLTTRIVCCCEHERREAAAAGLGPAERLTVVYNGCKVCDRSLSPHRALQALRGRGLVVGAIAVLRQQKRLDLLLQAAPEILRRVPAAHVVVIGNGPRADALRQQAEQLGLATDPRFSLLSFAPPVEQYLRALDVFVLPSDWEGLPVAVLEALACGVPQVVTAAGGTPEAVTEQTGIVIGCNDVSALADAIVSLLADEPRRRRMAEASVERHRQKFTVERMVAMTAAVYNQAIAVDGDRRRRS